MQMKPVHHIGFSGKNHKYSKTFDYNRNIIRIFVKFQL